LDLKVPKIIGYIGEIQKTRAISPQIFQGYKGVMTEFLTLRTVDGILDLLAAFEPLPAEKVPLDEALGRVLAESFFAPANLPGFDRSTVDGFAVRAADVFGASEGLPAALTLIGEVPMGRACQLTLDYGQTARVWTGGELPAGADAAAPLERARLATERIVELSTPLAPGANVVLADEDAKEGELLIPAGQTLRPAELGFLAAFGQTEVLVRRRPFFAILASGDEVVDVAAEPKPGQVRDVNSTAVAALVREAGGVARFYGHAPDDLEALAAKVQSALSQAEAVVLSGGSSAGRKDFTLKALASLPGTEILAHGAAISPGKPLILARQGPKSLWGLPGHPAGALVAAEIFLKALIRRLTGTVEPAWRRGLKARLTRPAPSAEGRRDYFRVRLHVKGEELWATPVLGKSGLISTLVGADALAICPEEKEGLAEGELAEIRLF
jgi:molybdopterin molybdotransferase